MEGREGGSERTNEEGRGGEGFVAIINLCSGESSFIAFLSTRRQPIIIIIMMMMIIIIIMITTTTNEQEDTLLVSLVSE